MLLCVWSVWSEYKLIFFVSGTFYEIKFFYILWKIKGDCSNDKKVYKKVHLYILGNSRKIAIFFGFTPYREKIYGKKSMDDVMFTPFHERHFKK